VTPEAKAVRPGPVILVVANRGRYVHGLRIEAEDELRVKAGAKVTWRDGDPAPHTVTGVGSFRGSGELLKGSVFSTRFARRGTYRYLCAIHRQMKGTVVVG
jgi:plastocyanin